MASAGVFTPLSSNVTILYILANSLASQFNKLPVKVIAKETLDVSGYIYLWLWIYVLLGLGGCSGCGVGSDPITKLNSTEW